MISSIIIDEFKIGEVNNIDFKSNISLINNILENEFKEIYKPNDDLDQYKISPVEIQQIVDVLKDLVQFKLSLRQIKCLLERITRFCLEDNYDTSGLKKIPVIYIVISYIIPQLKIGNKL